MKHKFYMRLLLIIMAIVFPINGISSDFKDKYCHYRYDTDFMVAFDALLETHFWSDSTKQDSVYALLFAVIGQPLDGEYGQTMSYHLYHMFENQPFEFQNIEDLLQLLPDSDIELIRRKLLEELMSYEEIEYYEQYFYPKVITPDSVKLYNQRFRNRFPESYRLFPNGTPLFEYMIGK